jgi:hypothetical protein
MKQKEAKNLMGKFMVASIKKQRTCLYPDCNEKSVMSHLLQKKGILNQIAEDQHVCSYYTNPQTYESKFKRTGINDAFSFQGYCTKHDDLLFRTIEKGVIDFSSDTNKLLFTFRAIFNELRKKEVINDAFNKAVAAHTLEGLIDKNFLKEYVRQNTLGARDLKYFLDLAHKNFRDETNDFNLSSLSFKRVPLCISTVVSVESNAEMMFQSLINRKQFEEKTVPSLVINCFPLEQESTMLIAYPKANSDRIEQFINDHVHIISNDPTLKSLSDLIIKFSETWTCSPSFYASNVKQHEKGIVKFSRETAHKNSHLEIPFNIFQQ